MLGLVLALAVTSSPAMPSASVTCAGWPASCDGAWGDSDNSNTTAAGADDAPADADAPREYATPVEVDCPTPPEPAPVATGECSEPPILNLWYRVSRSPDSEAPTGSLAPAPRRARAVHLVSAGGAPDPGVHLSAPDFQPLALVALPGLVPAGDRDLHDVSTRAVPARALAPPDRPPRV
ncbi:MAG TPA: hypothetical protein VKZ18_18580 [Polyangia bacterium]|nr:hypothetical protein [Polyangia bacterium]